MYSDAATAYLDGYQNYPKSDKAPDNLLKLGITMVQLGEKEQGCTMITGIKKQYPKASKSVLQKAQYEQKNSIVLNLKNSLSSSEPISNIFLNFKSKISKLKTNKFLVAVSGGPDSLALVALCRDYELNNKKIKFHYVLINHGIRKNSSEEAKQVKTILKKQNITLKVITNKKKIVNNIQHNARKTRYSLLSAECKKKKIRTILTGHHKDDQIETFLIRLSRGSGIQGLSSMSTITALDNKIKLFRPLLSEEKKNLIIITKKFLENLLRTRAIITKNF